MRQHASRFAVAACLLAAAFPTHGQSPKGAAGPPPPFGGPSWSLADQLAKGGATSSMVLDTGPAVRLVSVEGLQAAHSVLQTQIARELRMKRTPQLAFEYDPTVERGVRMTKLIDELAPDDSD